jgi:hypothetical protein
MVRIFMVMMYEQRLFLKHLKHFDETREDGRNRYVSTFYKVADKFPHENILFISHGKHL